MSYKAECSKSSTIWFGPDESDGGFVVTCRDLPEAVTQGETIEEAIDQAEGALEAAIESRIEDGMELPMASRPRKGENLVHLPVSPR